MKADNLQDLGSKFLEEASDQGHHYYEAIEKIIKGPEMELKPQDYFYDSDNNLRKQLRLKWRDREWMFELNNDPSQIITLNRPVFFGHYSLKEEPHLIDEQIYCLDFGDFKKEKHITAYKWDGEIILKNENMMWI